MAIGDCGQKYIGRAKYDESQSSRRNPEENPNPILKLGAWSSYFLSKYAHSLHEG